MTEANRLTAQPSMQTVQAPQAPANRAFALMAFLGALAIGLVVAVPAQADVDDENDVPATTELNEKTDERDQRRKGAIQDRQRRLKDERRTLQFEKRTKHPFRVERLQRRDIRRNEQRQNWNKGEIRRLEHRNRRHRSGAR